MTRVWRRLLPAVVLLSAALLAACGGDEPPPVEDPGIVVPEYPTEVPISAEDIEATLVATLTPPTPTPDVQATLTANLDATRAASAPAVTPGALGFVLEDDANVYMNEIDRRYMGSFGEVVWHATRVDMLVAGMFVGYVSDNADVVDFFGDYSLAASPSQWRCNERLRSAVYRELLNLQAEQSLLAGQEVSRDVSPTVLRYAQELQEAVRAVYQEGKEFLEIQSLVCRDGGYESLPEGEKDRVRDRHEGIFRTTRLFAQLMSGYGCAVCGELYRR